ncbi:MAG: hypothetical protein JSU95_05040 [Betaproteobacteria bacterium]|nr:MAG: hypothetical protein JSU95_05040 [Betaproteobacteria bacterium]
MKFVISAVVVAFVVVFQIGCSEPSQGVEYQDGRYAGKPDTPNWEGAAFDGNRENWEREIKRRTRLQSEYTRPGGA